MSENYYELNEKFWSTKGILGRRGYILNYCIMQVITSVLFTTPYIYICLFYPEIISTTPGSINSILLAGYFVLTALVENILIYPSIIRRVRDLLADDDDSRIIFVSLGLLVINLVVGIFILALLPFSKIISIFVLFILVFKSGKITGSRPHNPDLKFNLGAFFGTWLWGIFNKAPITFLMPIVALTPANLPFMLICGIKGNEWSLKNYKKSTEEFHNEQKAQAVVFFIITPFVALTLSGLAMKLMTKYNPTGVQKVMQTHSEKLLKSSVNTYFTNYELTNDKYTFYMPPQIWNNLPATNRIVIFATAIQFVQLQTGQEENSIDILKLAQIAQKTTILSNFNNEILAQYSLSENELKELEKIEDASSILDLPESGYKFNNHPSIP